MNTEGLFTEVETPAAAPLATPDEQALQEASVPAAPAAPVNVLGEIIADASRRVINRADGRVNGSTLRLFGYFIRPNNFTFSETSNIQDSGYGNPVANLQFVRLDPSTKAELPITVQSKGSELDVSLIRVNAYRPWTDFATDEQGKVIVHKTRDSQPVMRPNQQTGELRPVAVHKANYRLTKLNEQGKFLAFENPGWAEFRVTLAGGYSNYQLMSFRTSDLKFSESIASTDSLNLG